MTESLRIRKPKSEFLDNPSTGLLPPESLARLYLRKTMTKSIDSTPEKSNHEIYDTLRDCCVSSSGVLIAAVVEQFPVKQPESRFGVAKFTSSQ